jgi:aryl-alcohol dehydrogenase-like predicted oxidoreductase
VEYRNAGKTGLSVSALALGTMTWGRDTDETEAADQLADFCEAGGSLLDTAGTYGDGAAEELLGELLGEVVPRESVVIATKSGVGQRGGKAVADASRGCLLAGLEASLARLGTDYVDLWLVQQPDPRTPLAEPRRAKARPVEAGYEL